MDALALPSARRFRHAPDSSVPEFNPSTPPEPPAWILRQLGGAARERSFRACAPGFAVRRLEGGPWTLLSVKAAMPEGLDARPFEERCAAAYGLLVDRLRAGAKALPGEALPGEALPGEALPGEALPGEALHAVRLWNFIPRILTPLGKLPHHYMVFNAGRFAAFERWFGGALPCHLPTATGVGHEGDALVIHCLAATSPGRPVENPRQISAWRYSRRYGPRPPCFARATLLEAPGGAQDGSWLLVGGTASVRGEDSLFAGDLEAQAEETFRNLNALVAQLLPAEPARSCPPGFSSLRVYYPQQSSLRALRSLVEGRFPGVEIEYQPADLCRPELLIEIEGVAELPVSGEGF